jgi:hypothetical protein
MSGVLLLVGLAARLRRGRKVARHSDMLEPLAAASAGTAASVALAGDPTAAAGGPDRLRTTVPSGAPGEETPT